MTRLNIAALAPIPSASTAIAAAENAGPVRFEDEVEVHLRVREKREKSLTYDFAFRKVGDVSGAEVAHGSLTVVCVAVDPQTDQMRAVPIPDAIARQIEVAPEDERGTTGD